MYIKSYHYETFEMECWVTSYANLAYRIRIAPQQPVLIVRGTSENQVVRFCDLADNVSTVHDVNRCS